MKKYIFFVLFGYVLHFFGLEFGNMIAEARWQHCLIEMHKGDVPESHPEGGHYCLKEVWKEKNITVFENVLLYSLDLHEDMTILEDWLEENPNVLEKR